MNGADFDFGTDRNARRIVGEVALGSLSTNRWVCALPDRTPSALSDSDSSSTDFMIFNILDDRRSDSRCRQAVDSRMGGLSDVLRRLRSSPVAPSHLLRPYAPFAAGKMAFKTYHGHFLGIREQQGTDLVGVRCALCSSRPLSLSSHSSGLF